MQKHTLAKIKSIKSSLLFALTTISDQSIEAGDKSSVCFNELGAPDGRGLLHVDDGAVRFLCPSHFKHEFSMSFQSFSLDQGLAHLIAAVIQR